MHTSRSSSVGRALSSVEVPGSNLGFGMNFILIAFFFYIKNFVKEKDKHI